MTSKPIISWTGEENGARGKKKYYCQGVWICPSFSTCQHRLRATLPRRGENKYTTGNKVKCPKEKDWCPVHQLKPIHRKCECNWNFVPLKGDGTEWKIIHFGFHNHPAPRPIHAKEAGIEWVKNTVNVCPDMTTTEMMIGKAPRLAAREVDPAFHNKDYLKHTRRKA